MKHLYLVTSKQLLYSALVELLGLIFFTTQNPPKEQDGHIFKFGYSYALAWVVSFFGLMAGIFSLIEFEDGEVRNKKILLFFRSL